MDDLHGFLKKVLQKLDFRVIIKIEVGSLEKKSKKVRFALDLLEYRIEMQRAVIKLRWKYQNEPNKACSRILDHLVGVSFPIVYDMGEIGTVTDRMKIHQRTIDSIKRTRSRIRGYLRGMIASFDSLYLVTLTFSPEYYESTTRRQRDRAVKEWLKENTADYIGCLDIGSKNGREHYHAIVSFDLLTTKIEKVKFRRKTVCKLPDSPFKYGFIDVVEIKKDDKSPYKTLNYAFKATSYAIKASAEEFKIKPFHARGVVHWREIQDCEMLPF